MHRIALTSFSTTVGVFAAVLAFTALTAHSSASGWLTRAVLSDTTEGSEQSRRFSAYAFRGSETNDVPEAATVPGDCSGDSLVDAPDIPATLLELVDDDGDLAINTPGGTFEGNPGCDGNEDEYVDAGDVSCLILLIFNGPGSCD